MIVLCVNLQNQLVEQLFQINWKMDKEIVITVLILTICSILLPIADTYSDVSLIITLWKADQRLWASTSLAILISHTSFIASVWVRYEPRSEKAYTWIFVILNLWMSYKALFKYKPTYSLTLDMMNNFCFHVYAQKSLSHSLTLTLSLSHSHSHTLSISH